MSARPLTDTHCSSGHNESTVVGYIFFLPLPSSTSKTPALSGSVCNSGAEVTPCYSSVRKRWPLFEIPIKFKLTSCVPMWNGGSGAATQTLEEDVEGVSTGIMVSLYSCHLCITCRSAGRLHKKHTRTQVVTEPICT